MKVLIIGATGYIGRAVGEALLRRGHTVRGTLRAPNSASRLPSGVQPISGDITDPASIVVAARDVDAVIYAVQYTGADGFQVESKALQALATALAPGKKRLVFTSGVWYYGNTYPQAADEASPANPPAIVAKRPELERVVLDAAREGLHAIVVRPGDVFGRGGGMPAMWVQSAREGGAAQIIGDGGNHWPMVHIDDLALLYALMLEQAASGSIYNAVDDTRLTVQAMAEAASHGAGKHGVVTHVPVDKARETLGVFADALVLDQAVSSAKARKDLGWTPQAQSVIEDLQHGSYVQSRVT